MQPHVLRPAWKVRFQQNPITEEMTLNSTVEQERALLPWAEMALEIVEGSAQLLLPIENAESLANNFRLLVFFIRLK